MASDSGRVFHRENFMSFSSVFARAVAVVGAGALYWRRMQGAAPKAAWGSSPAIPEAKPQGAIPTLKMPTAQGLERGAEADGGAGAQGQRLCNRLGPSALDRRAAQWRRAHCRVDADRGTATERIPLRNAGDDATRRGARVSADRITLLRDRDGDGVRGRAAGFSWKG
jgi:hypothetical protein